MNEFWILSFQVKRNNDNCLRPRKPRRELHTSGNPGKIFSKRKHSKTESSSTMQGKILKHHCYELITKGNRVHVVNMCFRQFPVTGQKRKYFKDSSQAHNRFLALKMPENHPKVFGNTVKSSISTVTVDVWSQTGFDRQEQINVIPKISL